MEEGLGVVHGLGAWKMNISHGFLMNLHFGCASIAYYEQAANPKSLGATLEIKLRCSGKPKCNFVSGREPWVSYYDHVP